MEHRPETENVNEIVRQILQSPELRNNLANTVRYFSGNTSSVSSVNTTTAILPIHHQGPPANSSVRHELQRLFRRSNDNNEASLPIRSGRKRRREKSSQNCIFNRDTILVKQNSTNTLKGASKSFAYERGFALSNVQFNINWTHDELLENLAQLYNQFLEGKKFEIVVPIGGRLVKPNLSPGMELDGRNLKSIFNQKVVYIRALENMIPCTITASISDDTDTDIDEKENFENDVGEHFTMTDKPVNHLRTRRHSYGQLVDQTVNVDTQFEDDLELAINNSLNEVSDQDSNNIPFDSILKNLKKKVNEEIINYFNIYREDIFNCCVRAMRRKTFSPFHKIMVKFSDVENNLEGAVDLGGPTREMFRLVINYVKNSRLFFGENKKNIRLDMEALDNSEYFEAGRLISLSLIHGGPGPNFLSETFYHILIYGISDQFPTINDIESEIREKIVKINDIIDIVSLQEYVTEELIFSIAGYHFIKTIEEKKKLFQDVVQFYGYHRIRPALEQFKEGLKTGGIFEYMQQHEQYFKQIFCTDKIKITSNMLDSFFSIEYSETGSSKRNIENRIISFWRDFVLDCEVDDTMGVTPEDIFIFSTGADVIPPLGFENTPKIIFEHNDHDLFPKANTCALQLHLPTIHKTYDVFKYYICFGIGNCKDFAFA